VAETIKCACSHCGAKYRLPVEAQGRTARCKRCGEKFEVPRQQSLEDSILTWLTVPEEEAAADAVPAKPRVISMPAADPNEQSMSGKRIRGTIRMKEQGPKEQTA
jgi:DNA-directed RNA polymerase subunit RPC12/RpoP